MLYMGDEFANTQGGNNNPYNQDNETTWLDWRRRTAFADLVRFTARLTALRRRIAALSRPRAWGPDDVRWFGVGAQLDLRPDARSLAFALYDDDGAPQLYVMINAFWDELTFEVQATPAGGWRTPDRYRAVEPRRRTGPRRRPVMASRTGDRGPAVHHRLGQLSRRRPLVASRPRPSRRAPLDHHSMVEPS